MGQAESANREMRKREIWPNVKCENEFAKTAVRRCVKSENTNAKNVTKLQEFGVHL